MEEKFCPLTGKLCYHDCGWFVPTHDKCAMILIGDSVFPLMMSVTGEYPDNPLARIAENTDVIGSAMQDLAEATVNIASAM